MQLMWRRHPETRHGVVSSERSGPSWSWASSQVAVLYGDRLSWREDTLEIIGCDIQLRSPEFECGEAVSGCLTAKGYLRAARWTGHSFVSMSLDDAEDFSAAKHSRVSSGHAKNPGATFLPPSFSSSRSGTLLIGIT